MDLIADTTVLIDVWRFRNKRQRIQDLVEKAGQYSLVVPWIVQAEFTRGALHQSISREENFGISWRLSPDAARSSRDRRLLRPLGGVG